MTRLHDTTWPEVFSVWQAHEGANPEWTKVATEVKGWPDWESWRRFSADQMKLPTRTWSLWKFEDPLNEIPAMLVGPYSGWQSRLPEQNVGTFADLAAIPEQAAHFSALSVVKKLQQQFPSNSQFIGLRKPDGRMVCIEGHHRAMAVALARQEQTTMKFGTVNMAVADLRENEGQLLDLVLARGTSFTTR